MSIKFTVSAKFPASVQEIYHAWLNGDEHAAMTGVPAKASPIEGGSFTAWDNYISGENRTLIPFSTILQTWRTTEFSDEEEDSLLESKLEEKGDYTLLTLTHSNLPSHGIQYKQGWMDHYFAPMQSYFSTLSEKRKAK
jgi:hypothetical protein